MAQGESFTRAEVLVLWWMSSSFWVECICTYPSVIPSPFGSLAAIRTLDAKVSFFIDGSHCRHLCGVQACVSMRTKSGILATYSLDWIFDDLLVLQVLQVFPVLLVPLVLLVLLL